MAMSRGQPWVQKNRTVRSLRSPDVVIGERLLQTGETLRGLYAGDRHGFVAGDTVASYQGTGITMLDLTRLHEEDRARFDRISDYGVEIPDGRGFLYNLDRTTPGAHLINHSCSPNAEWGAFVNGGLLVRAIRPILPGEEITIHYGWLGFKAAHEKRWHPCACRAPYCTKTIELVLELLPQEEGGMVGIYLDVKEVARRFLADIVNGTDKHEGLLLRYATGAASCIPGARTSFDGVGYLRKLEQGAVVAVQAAKTGPYPLGRGSNARLQQIVRRYRIL